MLHVRKLATGEGTVLDYKCDGPGEKRLYSSAFHFFLYSWLRGQNSLRQLFSSLRPVSTPFQPKVMMSFIVSCRNSYFTYTLGFEPNGQGICSEIEEVFQMSG